MFGSGSGQRTSTHCTGDLIFKSDAALQFVSVCAFRVYICLLVGAARQPFRPVSARASSVDATDCAGWGR